MYNLYMRSYNYLINIITRKSYSCTCPKHESILGSSGISPLILNLGGIWRAPAALNQRKHPSTHSTGGWVGPRARLGSFGEKSLAPTRIRSPDRPPCSLVAIPPATNLTFSRCGLCCFPDNLRRVRGRT